jgi:hypothetical protein
VWPDDGAIAPQRNRPHLRHILPQRRMRRVSQRIARQTTPANQLRWRGVRWCWPPDDHR